MACAYCFCGNVSQRCFASKLSNSYFYFDDFHPEIFFSRKRSPGNSSSGHILKGGGRLRSKILGFQLLISVAESSDRHFCLTGHQEFEKTHTHLQLLGIFTGPMCLWGPVYGSRCLSVTHVFETLLM